MIKQAKVFYKKFYVGILTKTEEDLFIFEYDNQYLAFDKAQPISLTFPLEKKHFEAENLFSFFDGLIPEGWLLSLACDMWKFNPLKDRFELLLATCADSIGAVSVVPFSQESSQENKLSAIKNIPLEKVKKTLQKKFITCLYCYESLDKIDFLYHPKCSQRLFNLKFPPLIDFDSHLIKELAQQSLNRHLSFTGIQKKLSVDFDPQSPGTKIKRLTLTNLFGRFIFKPKGEPPHIPENEHLIMVLARTYGIETAECGLIPMPSGELAFISKRFDRDNKLNKYHVEDFCQLLGKEPYKKYSGSLEQVGRFLKTNSDFPGENILRLFELVIFCFLVGNVDLHLKNISLFHESQKRGGLKLLTPAYDLLSTDLYLSDNEQSALAIGGAKNNLKNTHFNSLATYLEISDKVRLAIYKKFKKVIPTWFKIIDKSYLVKSKKDELKKLIKKRITLLVEK